ncbi:BRCT domain-containing protein [Carex littledalei]|uniref:BRCT domain-containing protein n=1 Tax=Carex littledalei TaxID=544730 RepID=A0A833QEM3_9POAL|nr:BRCT domain-containing protein [Carex littledalei]
MLRSRGELSPSNIFSGVRFALFGFDSVSEEQYRLEITQKGGVDLGNYDPTCTHVIVRGRIYDDPICVMARDNGKIVVTETWIDDTLDFGARADETKVLYRPVRDLDGIPGSKSFHICLTGYQRQEREDIMRMVTMMGARFSKPLIANQITHLICYKFEGEKYELAKRVNIKLVNHRWLEDCLKAWAILPIDDYTKSGWELEIMEAEARDSEEETDTDVANRKSLDQTVSRPLHNGPSSSITHNPLIEYPAPTESGNRESRGLNQTPATTQSKDVGTEMMVNLPINSPPHSGSGTLATPNLPTKSPAPGPVNNCNSSSSIQVVTSGTNIGSEKMINLAVKSPSLSSGTITTAGPIPVRSCAGTPLKSPVVGRLIENPDLTTPEVNLSVKAPSLQYEPASSIALDPPVKSPAPGPFNSQGARDHSVTMLYEESGLTKLNLPVKSPFTAGNNTPRAVPGLPSQNLDLQDKSIAPNPFNDPENLDKLTKIDSRSEKMISSPIKKTPLVTSNHTLQKDHLVRNPAEEIKSGEIANLNVKSSLVTEARDRTMVKTPLQEISSEKSISSIKMGQSKPQSELRCEKRYNTETPDSAKSARLSLSENKGVSSSELISSTNLGLTGNSATSLQVGIRSKKGLSVPSESPLETPKCRDLSSDGEHGSCGARLPVLTNSTGMRRSYTRKLRKKSASPEELQSDPSVNTATPKVILGISPQGLGGRNGAANRDVEKEKSAEQSCASLPQKRKASDDPVHNSPLVANDFEELERINSLPKERDTGNNNTKMVLKNSKTKRTSLKCAKPPRCSPSSLNNIGLSEASDKAQVEEKKEPATTKQPDAPDFSKYFGSPTDNVGIGTSTSVSQDGDIEIRDALMQSGKVQAENNLLEMKGLSPDSVEAELHKHLSDTTPNPCNNHKNSTGARIKKAVAKRSMKGKVQNPGKNVFLKAGNNSGAKPNSSSNNTPIDATRDKREASDAGPGDADSGFLRELSNSSAKPETGTKSPEIEIRNEAETSVARPKNVRTNVSKKMGKGKREKMTNGSNNNKSNVTMDWLLTSIDVDPEKENKPGPGEPSTADSKSVLKCNKPLPTQEECTSGKDQKLVHASMGSVACFILSGHRLQRKEFQAVIKKLRGRVCRDTHNWSFQATHFIVPGPVRRTEKFFAAAASGRWILKMEYLTASNEAGRLIEEEPYEWYGTGMTEDSSISLEAPRKWRLVREQTGHGAFYGMHIVIYGECIAPSLDTMKRVIKAGDGTILATSPPYTRVLKSNSIDFAVVPATTPSNDPWVREFLNHQIPCVTSDYLVEFVCKPGYSLSKHVLFQTQEWAEKSLQKLTKLCQEVVREFNSPLKLRDDSVRQDNLRCAVCGSHERAEVMLICGDESGSVGCGIGTHIDCCDPPLEVVPEDDWFCCKCNKIRTKKSSLAIKSNKRSKKG